MLPNRRTDNSIRIFFIDFHDPLVTPGQPEELTHQIRVVAFPNNEGLPFNAMESSSGAFASESQLMQAAGPTRNGIAETSITVEVCFYEDEGWWYLRKSTGIGILSRSLSPKPLQPICFSS